jgi:hypothetical protein
VWAEEPMILFHLQLARRPFLRWTMVGAGDVLAAPYLRRMSRGRSSTTFSKE